MVCGVCRAPRRLHVEVLSRSVSYDAAVPIQDGPAWWRAREAIDAAHEAQRLLGAVAASRETAP